MNWGKTAGLSHSSESSASGQGPLSPPRGRSRSASSASIPGGCPAHGRKVSWWPKKQKRERRRAESGGKALLGEETAPRGGSREPQGDASQKEPPGPGVALG